MAPWAIKVALELEKDDAYQLDFDEDDFLNFTYVFKETDCLVLHSDINLIIPFLF